MPVRTEGPWFVAPREFWSEGEIVFPPDEARHAVAVLRVRPPDVVTVTDGDGRVARCAIEEAAADTVRVAVLDAEDRRRARPEVVVYQGAAKGSKSDDVVERLAEIGVTETWVFSSARAVVKWDAGKTARLAERWSSLARSAAKQSRNPFIMRTGAPLSWTELLRRIAREPAPVVLWEGASLPLRTAFGAPADRIALVVGPEGGFSRDEADALADAGAQVVSLGPTILRTENAALVAAAALQFHYGLLG